MNGICEYMYNLFCLLASVPWFTVHSGTLLTRVIVPLSIGTVSAFVTAMIISFTVLLSATSTTLRFRAGLIPFADYAKVITLRIAPDQVAFLRGIMTWSVIAASLVMGIMICVFIFLFLWQVSSCALSSSQISHQSLISCGLFPKLVQVTAALFQKIAASILGKQKPPGNSACTCKRVSWLNHIFLPPTE